MDPPGQPDVYIKPERSPSPSSPPPDVSTADLEFLLQDTITKRALAFAKSSDTTSSVGLRAPNQRLNGESTGDLSDEDSADERQDKLDRQDSDFQVDGHAEQDSDGNLVIVKIEKSSDSKSNNPPEPKTKRKIAKTSHEYWQRELQREKEKDVEKEAEEKKRKLNGDGNNPKKGRKTSAKSSAGVDARNLAGLMANTLHSMDDIDESFANGSVPSMGSIQASSKRDQIRQMINSVPPDLDNRQTKTQKAELKQAMTSFGFCNVEQANGKWRLTGISQRLESHQLTAAQWMVKREAMELSPAGGILADDTGMGKTVSTLACIVSHPPEPNDIKEFSKATLIVLPNRGMVTQWLGQIEKFCYSKDASDRTVRYSKAEGRNLQWWGSRWVVLTTYSELVSQSVKPAVIKKLKSDYQDDKKGFAKALSNTLGPLFNIPKYRWVLTATPISNGIQEFYPYLKFIGCSFTRTPAEFTEQYITGENADQNIRFIVSMVMLRRTHKDTFLGKKITNLPSSKCHDLWVTPPSWELILSKASDSGDNVKFFETGANIDAVDNDTTSGEPDVTGKPDAKSLTAQVTRMRQAASHPFNLEKFLQESKHQGKIEWILEQYKYSVKQQQPNTDAEQQVEDAAQWEPFLPGQQQLETEYQSVSGDITDMTKLFSLAVNEHNNHGLCEHAYCKGCLIVALKNARKEQAEGTPEQCPADDCSVELVRASPPKTPQGILNAVHALKDFKEPGTDSIGSKWLGDGRGKEKGTDCFFAATCGRDDIDFGPVRMPWGAKLTATVQVILTWLKKSPDDKIIVFIEFTITAKVLGCILEKLGLKFLYYNQIANTQARRDKAYKEFQKDPKIRILVASMKCGGTGLNLQIANLVIIDDVWFNNTVEQQAYGRVHRIGQKKETKLVRILARGTIDERIVMLQEAKAEIVRRVLQDDEHEPTFSDDLQLRILLTAKDKDAMINELKKETGKRRVRPKKTAAKERVKKSVKTDTETKKTRTKSKVMKRY
ncbi:unnamed protein product [Fusarium venenatum]|uniref:Helicase C-terminal domain-containing protein n=1 Tax=Fusarium venenatum TaxID=56646 RepID=A0A2L2TJW9_9HYPO|nr:uncharacterized protein FVRRES_08420 [Fusarium venenatum]CEI68343.1 unnamed protein product [Fusarium venenatum]